MGRGRRPAGSGSGSGSGVALQRARDALAAVASGSGASAGLAVASARQLSTLWAGYGVILECETDDDGGEGPLIIKEVAPPPGSGVSHMRKLRSYQVEAAFYERVAPRLPPDAACRLPRCLGVHSTLGGGDGGGTMQLVMSDLRASFPRRCGTLDEPHARAALAWLAAFHAACWGADAQQLGLWPEGCYWHLATRQEELEAMGPEWRQLRAAAAELDARLRATPFRTLTHGDFKAENLLFGGQPPAAAAYDLQYCGGGSGTKDVAYLFVSALPARLLAQQEGELLAFYHQRLLEGLREVAAGGGGGVADPAAADNAVQRYCLDTMLADYRVALCDYVRFMAGWGFWGQASWATARAGQYLEELGLAQ